MLVIFEFSLAFDVFAFFTFAISRSSIPCATAHFAGSASTLPA
jgi:hypothetical protein